MASCPYMNKPPTSHLDRLLDPVTKCFTPGNARQLAGLKIDPASQARLDELAEKSTEGELTLEERDEYQTYVYALDFLTVLQAQAKAYLEQNQAS